MRFEDPGPEPNWPGEDARFHKDVWRRHAFKYNGAIYFVYRTVNMSPSRRGLPDIVCLENMYLCSGSSWLHKHNLDEQIYDIIDWWQFNAYGYSDLGVWEILQIMLGEDSE